MPIDSVYIYWFMRNKVGVSKDREFTSEAIGLLTHALRETWLLIESVGAHNRSLQVLNDIRCVDL